jgi:hypothetical protein
LKHSEALFNFVGVCGCVCVCVLCVDEREAVSRCRGELHRCFFLHLGIAAGLHPFALQCLFRVAAADILSRPEDEAAIYFGSLSADYVGGCGLMACWFVCVCVCVYVCLCVCLGECLGDTAEGLHGKPGLLNRTGVYVDATSLLAGSYTGHSVLSVWCNYYAIL